MGGAQWGYLTACGAFQYRRAVVAMSAALGLPILFHGTDRQSRALDARYCLDASRWTGMGAKDQWPKNISMR